jgi:hypothetical protein
MEYNNICDSTNNDFNINNISNNLSKINIDNITLKKKKLIEISKNLTNIEYLEIFNIIKEDNCNYSENKNGVFINLLNISEDTIDKIFNFINFIKHKREDLMKHEEYLNVAKQNISNIIKNTENNIINNESDKVVEILEEEDNLVNENYLVFSSDEDEDLENKILLKKKKIKYSGKKAKMIKSIKDSNDVNKLKNRNKKND